MKSSFVVKEPENIEFSMTITMSLKDWKALQENLKDERGMTPWPASDLNVQINKLVQMATHKFWPSMEDA